MADFKLFFNLLNPLPQLSLNRASLVQKAE